MRPPTLSLLAFCSTLVNAVPIEQRDSVGVSQATLAQFSLFSQYAKAAYCWNNVQGAPSSLKCSADGGSCPLVESAQSTVLKTFTAGSTRTVGYVARDDVNKLIIVAIQGTSAASNPIDIVIDGDIIQRRTLLCGNANTHDGCSVHDGFFRAMVDAITVVNPVVAAAVTANPTYKIVTVGHSLGGAVAALLGTQLRNQGFIVDIYTYGQPHVGNADISHYIQSQAPKKGNNYRMTHTNDVVPQLPPHDWMPEWDHYYPEYWIDTNTMPVPSTQIKVINGNLFSRGGNEGAVSGLGFIIDIFEGVHAHSKYFGYISVCNSSPPRKKHGAATSKTVQ